MEVKPQREGGMQALTLNDGKQMLNGGSTMLLKPQSKTTVKEKVIAYPWGKRTSALLGDYIGVVRRVLTLHDLDPRRMPTIDSRKLQQVDNLIRKTQHQWYVWMRTRNICSSSRATGCTRNKNRWEIIFSHLAPWSDEKLTASSLQSAYNWSGLHTHTHIHARAHTHPHTHTHTHTHTTLPALNSMITFSSALAATEE